MKFINGFYSIVDNDTSPCSTIVDLLVQCQIALSKREAKILISQGGLYLNDIKINENREISTDDFLHNEYIVIRKGKRNYFIAKFL